MTTPWTREAIEALGPTTNVETAASVLDVSPWLAYQLIARDEFPTRVLRLGRKIKIPTHDLVALLFSSTPDNREAGPHQGPAVATNVPKDTTDANHRTPDALPLRAVQTGP